MDEVYHKRFAASIVGRIWLADAINRIARIVGSREGAEEELLEHLQAGRLSAKVWRQAGGTGSVIPVPPEYWTLETLRQALSANGVDQGNGRNWYHVGESRLKELYPAWDRHADSPASELRKAKGDLASARVPAKVQEEPAQSVRETQRSMILAIIDRIAPDGGMNEAEAVRTVEKYWEDECRRRGRDPKKAPWKTIPGRTAVRNALDARRKGALDFRR